MKKIMKRALSLMLVLALAIMPMTVMAAEGDSVDEPVVLASRDTEVTVPANSTVYFADTYNPMMGDASVMAMTVEGATGFAVSTNFDPWSQFKATTNDTNGKVQCNNAAFSMGMGGTFYFTIENKTSSSQDYSVKITVPTGVEANKDVLKMGENKANTFGDYNGYFYSYTAPADGKLTVSFDPAAGWLYKIMDDSYNDLIADGTEYSDDDPQTPVTTVDVTANANYMVIVNTYDPQGGMNQNPVGTVAFEAYFEANTKGTDNSWAEYAQVEEGDNNVYLDGTVTTTLYEFVPERTGKFTVTVSDGMLVSNWGANTWPSKNGESGDSVVIECSSVGQGFLIGVESESAWAPKATVSISWEPLQVTPQIVPTVYTNKVTPENFTFTGKADSLKYVNTEDTIVDKAVLGTDGKYHLNTADGPVLYVDLDDTVMNLIDAMGYGQLKETIYEGENPTAIIDYNTALGQYADAADSTTKLYPLTEDLMTIYQKVGESKGWYGENGWVGGVEEDAWMFACYYEEVSAGPANPSKPAPSTGDHTNATLWILVMMVGVAAAGTSIVMKKRER